jgi:hypothetical protein
LVRQGESGRRVGAQIVLVLVVALALGSVSHAGEQRLTQTEPGAKSARGCREKSRTSPITRTMAESQPVGESLFFH